MFSSYLCDYIYMYIRLFIFVLLSMIQTCVMPVLFCLSFSMIQIIKLSFFLWQHSKDNWRCNPNESNFLHNLYNGWWVGWYCCRDFNVEATDNISLEEYLPGEDREGQGRGNGSRKYWFPHWGAPYTVLYLTRHCVFYSDTSFTSVHNYFLWPGLSCVPSSGKQLVSLLLNFL